MIDPHHIWNVIYNARSNNRQPPTSAKTAPATENESHDWSASHMKRHLQCAEQQASPSNFTKYCACHAKWISWLIHITYETSFTMRGATVNTLQPHQILRLPRKMNLMIEPHHIWNVIYNARSNSQHPPTSPNTAPATQNESHDWSTSHMKRHLQCAEQQSTPSNLTKYCACHAKWPPNIWQKFAENSWNVISNARPIRPWSETVPRPFRDRSDPENAKLNPPRRQGYFSHSPDSIENYNVSRSGYHSKFHHMLRLPRKVTPNAAPATKSDTWTPPNAAPATKSDTWTSPNAAPATKSDTKWHMTTTTTTTTPATTTTTTSTTTRTTTTRTTTTRTTTTRTTTTRTTTTTTTTTRTTTATTTTARTTIPVRLPKSSYIGSLPLNFLW